MVVGDPKVSGRRLRLVKTQPFHNDVIGQIVFLYQINCHPNQHTPEVIKLIDDMRRRNPNAGPVVFWGKLR